MKHPGFVGLLAGSIGGAAVTTAFVQKWGMELGSYLSDAAGSTLIAGFGGAVVGGAISYLLARQATKEALSRDQAMRLDEEHAAALRTFGIALELTNRAFSIQRIMRDTFKAGLGDNPFTRLVPMVKPPATAVSFASADFIPFIKGGHAALLSRCAEYASQVATLERGLDEYGELRRDWDEFAEPHTVFGPTGVANTQFAGEDARRAKFKARKMNVLIGHLAREAPIAASDGEKLCRDLHKAYVDYFGTKALIKLDIADPSSQATSMGELELARHNTQQD